jgi:hypothetical protein
MSLTKKLKINPIERDKEIEPRKPRSGAFVSLYEQFEKMKPGDSFVAKGIKSPTQLSIAFGYWLARGKYAVRKEGSGYRFHLLKEAKQEKGK